MRLLRRMDQPLWQNLLNIALIGFVARRAALVVTLEWNSLHALVRSAHVAVLLACLVAAVAVWLSARWVVASLCALTAFFTCASLLELRAIEPALRSGIILQMLVALLATVVLVKLARDAAQHPEA